MRDEFVRRLGEKSAEISEQIEKLNELIGEYNEITGEVADFRDEIAGEMDDYYNDRSERWQEGEAGSAYMDWKTEWEGLLTDDLEEVEEPSYDTLDGLENLPEGPGEE